MRYVKQDPGMTPRDKWIPYYFVAFFVVFCAVDGVMAYLAIKTQTGVVTEHHYEKGLRYNETIAQAEKMEKLGWKGSIRFAPDAGVVDKGTLSFSLNDPQTKPVAGAKVTAKLVRPTQAGNDEMIELKEAAPGNYQAAVAFPLQGQWDVEIAVLRGDDRFQMNERLVIR